MHGLLYATSFEHGSLTYMAREGWDTTGCAINTSTYHSEDGVGEPTALSITGASGSTTRTPAVTGARRAAWWLAPLTPSSPAVAGFVFELSGSAQVFVQLNVDGSVSVYRGNEIFGTLLTTSTPICDRGVANWFGVYLHADNAGTLEVAVNGAVAFTYTADLQALASPGWNQIRWRIATAGADHVIDNLLLFDDSETWLPTPVIAQVKDLSSVVSGSLVGSSATGSARWQNVNDPGDTSDYNEGASAGDGDLYGCDALAAMGDVLAVVVNVEAERSGALTAVEAAVSEGGTTDYAAAQTLPVSGFGVLQAVWETNPDTGSAWTPTAASDAAVGARFA